MSAQHHLDPVRQVSIGAMRDARLVTRDDLVVVEEPLEIRVAGAGDEGPGTSLSVTMRTPGHDVELAVGFLHGEGIVRFREDIAGSRISGLDGNIVRIQLAGGVDFDAAKLHRHFYMTSSCGVCGNSSLAAVERMLRSPHVDGALKVSPALIESLSERARTGQDVFRETGGLHASCLFDAQGKLLDVREDVGRHNALDKLIGALLRDGADTSKGFALITSRASVEMVQKSATAGIAILAAVSAPTALAVRVAESCGQTLIGFARGNTFSVYTGGERVAAR
jgi:FdhD protein